ncbi:hypothetical protein QCA50_014474 [Cerrena zonata]|uniref:Alpha/beta hydrolase fold-3 domain-containing protein n=1 Tax=Cerrena zonata TaxID=2478898 RepID=A0AAW0FN44_9APHY
MTDLDWTRYSEPEPDLAPLLSQLPHLVFTLENIPTLRQQSQEGLAIRQNAQKHLLPTEHEYTLKDYKIPVEGGEVTVRTIVPTAKDGEDTTFPLYVWYHGGGWIVGSIDGEDYKLRTLAVELRISVANIEYRLCPEYPYPTGLKDAYAGLKWAVNNASLLSASLDKGFIIGGVSAGANFATVLSRWARDDEFFKGRPLTGQVLQIAGLIHSDAPYPEKYKHLFKSPEQNKDSPILDRAAAKGICEIVNAPPEDPNFSAILAPDLHGLPPAYFQVAGADLLRDVDMVYELMLRELGIRTKVDIYPGLPHGGASVMMPGVRVYDQWHADYPEGIKWLLDGAPVKREA